MTRGVGLLHLDLFMFLRSFKLFAATLLTILIAVACGGESAPAPTGLKVTPGDTSATVTWDMVDGVEYWLFYAPTSIAPTDTTSMQKWIGLPGGNTLLKVTSPYLVTGVFNGTTLFARVVNDAMYSSPDGVTWSAINYATSSNLNGASYFGTYKVVGDGGLVLLSSDAITWTAQTTPTTKNLYAIAGNSLNLNVAVGAGGTIITSPDGVSWSLATNSATSSDLYAVTYSAYNGGTWVAVGAGGTMVESADGLTWHSVTSNATTDLRGITSMTN